MHSSAINTVRIQAVHGRSDELGLHLARIAEAVREAPGCLDYRVQPCPVIADRWIVSGHWQNRQFMESHFALPALQGFIELIDNRVASSLDFNH